jgi:hypothetical protein
MKKIITLLSFGICTLSFAQFTFSYRNGAEIPNGSVVSFNTHSQTSANLNFHITNTTTNDIDVRIKCVSINNATGEGFQLCYGGLCHDNIVAGGIYPDYQFIIEPGQNNGNFDYFVNNNGGNGQIQEYLFEIYALDMSGFPIGDIKTFTYKYDQSLSSPTFESLSHAGIHLGSTILSDFFAVSVENITSVELYNVNGQLVQRHSLNQGSHNIAVQNLSSGLYLAKFSTGSTQQTVKLVKK